MAVKMLSAMPPEGGAAGMDEKSESGDEKPLWERNEMEAGEEGAGRGRRHRDGTRVSTETWSRQGKGEEFRVIDTQHGLQGPLGDRIMPYLSRLVVSWHRVHHGTVASGAWQGRSVERHPHCEVACGAVSTCTWRGNSYGDAPWLGCSLEMHHGWAVRMEMHHGWAARVEMSHGEAIRVAMSAEEGLGSDKGRS